MHTALVVRALLATAVMVALFFAGTAPAKAAIIIGGLLLLTRRLKSERVYAEIDWSLLLMFAGLFIIVAGAQHALLTPGVIAAAGRLHLDQVPVLSGVTAVLSNLVSNVPAVLVLKPFIEPLRNRDTAWLVVAMSSTLAGNFTVLGSIANLIVVQKAAARGVVISFWDYFKVGAPLTVLTIADRDALVVAVTKGRRTFHPASLDAVNFLLADVRGALGPYLNVFLVTQQHWSQESVGLVTTIGGLLGLAVQTPVGAAIDATRAKRGLIVLALAVLAVGATVIFAAPWFWPVLVANTLMAVVGDVFGPAVAALTLGLVGRALLARRMGRNSAFDHAGNVAIALAAGAVGWAFSQRAVFLLVPVFTVLAAAAVLSIPASAIDHSRARGADRHTGDGGRRRAVELEGAAGMPAAGRVWVLRAAVPFRQRAVVAAGGAEAGAGASALGHGDDVVLHHRGTGGDAADRLTGRAHRG